LKAIEEFSDLGSGFNIAMQDLDIRGAGNLLGAEQSGFISDMGYETYQKILAEAMEELGVETGLTSKNINDSYVQDCTIETDQQALIPDGYMDITNEKIRIYKQLDSMTNSKEIDRLRINMADRFGKLPPEVENLFLVVRVRNLGGRLGFEKIIIKNGLMIMFFISNPMSPFYKSKVFDRILENINAHSGTYNLKQVENKLKIVIRGVDSMEKAYSLLEKLQ
jgi:transcription-repair coupling factor (superfamily II helicase)